jgi:hypothetical protein
MNLVVYNMEKIQEVHCEKCNFTLIYISPKGQWYCNRCGEYRPKIPPPKHHPMTLSLGDDLEYKGIMPDRYDALFYFGMILFFLMLFFTVIFNSYVAIIGMVFGNTLSMAAVILDITQKKSSISGLVGNIIAVIWIFIAWMIIIFIWMSLEIFNLA